MFDTKANTQDCPRKRRSKSFKELRKNSKEGGHKQDYPEKIDRSHSTGEPMWLCLFIWGSKLSYWPGYLLTILIDKPRTKINTITLKFIYIFPLFCLQALCGVVFQVPTMSGDKLRISTMQEIIKPNTVKRIQGYGLPFPKDTTRKGDLLVAFDIQFPEKLTAAQKEVLRDML